jgi:hypothetical protein
LKNLEVFDICRDADQGMDDCLWRNSEPQTAIKLPSIDPKIPPLRTTEPRGPFSYIVDSVGSSWIAFSGVVSRSDYESAALPLSYLGPGNKGLIQPVQILRLTCVLTFSRFGGKLPCFQSERGRLLGTTSAPLTAQCFPSETLSLFLECGTESDRAQDERRYQIDFSFV